MLKKISAVFNKVGLGRLSIGEYKANLNGLNMFFGAVLGFVLSGTENLDSWQFGQILMLLAGAVVFILYISSSKHRVVYSICALAMSLAFPELVEFALQSEGLVPDKIRPTLLVWTVMTIIVEFWGRERSQPPQS
ncbi:hypothetical protein [Lysobacter sp. A289]